MVDFKKALKKQPRIDLNPSSADRWTTCTASPAYILENWDKLPPSDTKFSQEGTTAHEVASAFLQDREPNTKDAYCCPVPVNKEMRTHGWNYAEYVTDLRKPGSRLLVEQKLPLWYMHGRNAIVDAAVINPDHLHIVDYKYGAGVVVSPENSLQATIYAKSIGDSLNLPGEFPVTIHIYQPRGRASVDAPHHIWETTWGGVESLASVATKSATLITGNAVMGFALQFKPSEKACQWCPAKGFCTERQKLLTGGIEALAVIDASPMTLPPSKTVSVNQLSAILRHKAQIIKWLGDAEDYALDHLKAGNKIPGYKLVTSRGGNRYWSNPQAAGKLLLSTTMLRREEVISETIIGPAAAEKLLGKQKFSIALTNLISKPSGSPCIAPEDDKREECLINGNTEFDAIDSVDALDDF